MEIFRHRVLAAAIAAVALVPSLGAAAGGGALPPAIATVIQTSTADFAAGSLSNISISEVDSSSTAGQLRLQPLLSDLFLTTTLDPRWHITLPSSGYTPQIDGGVLDVQERDDEVFERSAMESWTTFEAGVTCEMRAIIYPGSAFTNIGFFSSTTALDQWAYFSTRGSGNELVPVIKTSVRTASGIVDIPTAVTLGQWHVFKIVWTPDVLEFHVDDVLVDTRTGVNLDLPQHVAMYKTDASDSPLLVDWIRVTPYTETVGDYESTILDAGTPGTPWTTLTWLGDTPAGGGVTFSTRTGDTPSTDGSWSNWSALGGDGAITSPPGRYAQYRATVTTGDLMTSPAIDEVQLSYSYPDETRPVVTSTTPPDAVMDVPVSTAIAAVFSEAMDQATVNAASFTVRPTGGPAVPATVTYDPDDFTATLTPTTPLAHATIHEARLATAITDLEGNALASAHVWTFTTEPQDLTPPTVAVTDPPDGATGISPGRPVIATLAEAIDPVTLTTASFTLTTASGTAVPASVSYDPDSRRAILDPAADLTPGTLYMARLTTAITDLAGNRLIQDVVWSFSTRYGAPVTVRATTAADFAAGDLSGVMITEIDNRSSGGQLRLTARLNDTFDEPDLATQWRTTRPEGYVPVIEDGILDVQERDDETYELSAIESVEAWGPGVVLEARAMFVPGSRFIDIGFDVTTNGNTQYAWFSTAGTGDQPGEERIFARIREYDHDTVAIPTDITYNEWHVFKIIWTHGQCDFFADGVLVASRSNVVITAPLHAAFYKSNDSATPFLVDWARVTPYTSASGTYMSPVLDSEVPESEWFDLEWSGTTPEAASVGFDTRTGETATTDGAWSAWSPVIEGVVASPVGRYAQYRAQLAAGDPLTSPVIDEIRLSHGVPGDTESPTVLEFAPADLAVDVAIDALVTASFSEPIAPLSLTAESFTLTPQGGSAVLAAVSYDPATFTATLAPASELVVGTVYEARLTTTVTDTVANRLVAEHHWFFMTVAPLVQSVPPVTALGSNVPNPFNAGTRVEFALARGQEIRLRVYGVNGRLVRTLVSGRMAAGQHSLPWDGTDDEGREAASGVYLLRLETVEGVEEGKMLMLK